MLQNKMRILEYCYVESRRDIRKLAENDTDIIILSENIDVVSRNRSSYWEYSINRAVKARYCGNIQETGKEQRGYQMPETRTATFRMYT